MVLAISIDGRIPIYFQQIKYVYSSKPKSHLDRRSDSRVTTIAVVFHILVYPDHVNGRDNLLHRSAKIFLGRKILRPGGAQ